MHERRVKRAQTWERGPPSALAEIFLDVKHLYEALTSFCLQFKKNSKVHSVWPRRFKRRQKESRKLKKSQAELRGVKKSLEELLGVNSNQFEFKRSQVEL